MRNKYNMHESLTQPLSKENQEHFNDLLEFLDSVKPCEPDPMKRVKSTINRFVVEPIEDDSDPNL